MMDAHQHVSEGLLVPHRRIYGTQKAKVNMSQQMPSECNGADIMETS